MRIILLGPQGSGKTAISRQIAEKYDIPVVKFQNVADELNATAKEDSELGRLAKESIASGSVSDDVCTAVLRRVLGKEDLSGGFLLVDYPKDSGQANAIDEAMNRLKRPVDLVLMIDIDRDELMERRVGRIDCDDCGAHYNLYVNPPMVEGVCDACGSRVSRRPRGYEENIANRLRDYDMLLGPILEHYRLNGKLRYVDGNGTEEQLWEGTQKIIDATPPTIIETEPVAEAAVSVDDKPEKETAESGAKKPKSAGTATGKSRPKPARKKSAKKKVAAARTTAGSEKRPRVVKKVAKKKTVAKAVSKKKTTSKKAVTRKSTVKKKPVAKKKPVIVKKPVQKKVAKKAATRKTVTKKKAVSKKKVVAVKKTAVKKTAVKKTAVKKTVAKKTVARKTVARKTVAKKTVAKKTVARKTVAKKTVAKKTVTRKKPATKKVGKKKLASKKTARQR